MTARGRLRRRDVGDLPCSRTGLLVEELIDLAHAHLVAAPFADERATVMEVEEVDLHLLVALRALFDGIQGLLRLLRSCRHFGLRARAECRRHGIDGHIHVRADGVNFVVVVVRHNAV